MNRCIKSYSGKSIFSTAFAVLVMVLLASTGALAEQPESETDPWQFGVSIYGWLPDISGQTAFSRGGGTGDFTIGIDQILDNLEFTLMGMLDIRKGQWGFLTDIIYLGVGNEQAGVREGTIGGREIPVNASAHVSLDLVSWICSFTGYYRAFDQPSGSLDFVVGARYLDMEQTVSWGITGNVGSIPIPDRTGIAEAGITNWDLIVGVRGRYAFGDSKAWFVPYYMDIGTGNSDLTLQGVAGLGYAFQWGEVTGAWRYLYYDLPSDSVIRDMNFSGPAIGVTFRW